MSEAARMVPGMDNALDADACKNTSYDDVSSSRRRVCMTGVIENMRAEDRLDRMKALADELVAIVREKGSVSMADALSAVAARLRTAISQVKYGLNYALSHRLLILGNDDLLIPA